MRGFLMLWLYLFSSNLRNSTSLDSINPRQLLRDGDTIASASGRFELGFFSPENSRSRYLGVWFKMISPQTVVWVANREVPLFNTLGILNITGQGKLILFNSSRYIVWSSNVSRPARLPVAQLLETGNLVIRDENNSTPDNYLWQSFDYPSDTFLPGMKLGSNLITGLERFLSSWKSLQDPGRGEFSLHIKLNGYPQLFLFKGNEILYRAGSWNGKFFTGGPREGSPTLLHQFIMTENETYLIYEPRNTTIISREMINPAGLMQIYGWNDKTNTWMVFNTAALDQCENYALCGADSICNVESSPACACLDGFIPASPRNWNSQEWSDGCIRRTPLDCNYNSKDRFLKYTQTKPPDTSSSWFDRTISLKECEVLCLKNCSCTAYAYLDVRDGGSGCLLWFGNLTDTRVLAGGQDIYVRIAASGMDEFQERRRSSKKRLVGIIGGCSLFLTCLLSLIYLLWRHLKKQAMPKKYVEENYKPPQMEEDMGLSIFSLKTISHATNNFSLNNKLGQGGFGSVYKGTLKDGREVAVKRLSKSSGQGLNEFKNEVQLIAKLQHRNLVKLLGCCTHEDEKMLIYEYMPNKSLDFFIFDKVRSGLLDWDKRLHIIGGISRGLLYLHQDSRLKIIHRDLKISNILLDIDMNPKISDFGLARAFVSNQTEANTVRIVGTYGYMSPEYAMDGQFSMKSDVFSYGVMVLEIISGKKNRGFCHEDHNLNLIGHAWKLWIKGTSLEIIDECLIDSLFSLNKVLRCIHVALLCVQHKPEDRPNMSSVVVMLDSESALPEPKQPGFLIGSTATKANGTSSNSCPSCSANEVTETLLEPR